MNSIMPAPSFEDNASWGQGQAQADGPTSGQWDGNGNEPAPETASIDAGGEVQMAESHGFDVGVKADLYPEFDPERQKIKDAGWVESVPYKYEEGVEDPEVPRPVRDWAGNARIYEWSGEEGDVGPESQELELELFGDPDKRSGSGIDFST